MQHKINKSIELTKKEFEKSFEADYFYNKQTQDKYHLESILNFLEFKDSMKILDLGTGTGYLAFPIAKKYPKIEVIGLDIVEKTLAKNCERADKEKLSNLQFVNYDGLSFPFADNTFDMLITRYALHHFPSIEDTFREISRVVKPGGKFFISDPAPNDDDTKRFVDAYMQMKKDGHIKFYTKTEWKRLGESTGFELIDSYETSIRFAKKNHNASEFNNIIANFDKQIIKGYEVEIINDEIWIRERVNNVLFRKV